MKTIEIRSCADIRLRGRYDKTENGFPMYWCGAYAEMYVKASRLEITVECGYSAERRHYISFEVDGLRSQTFSPLEGVHDYTVFLGMDANRVHHVRIIKETQPYLGSEYVKLLNVKTDGEIAPLKAKKRRIEFIGDSISAGEGCRGPVEFSEWLPMMFCSSDNYTRMTADALDAEYQTLALSGWGVVCSWDNDPRRNIPSIYDKLSPECGKDYDFDFKPDTVVIALGTNDNNALTQPAFTNPDNGEVFLQKDDEAHMKAETDGACAFIKQIHAKNPGARIIWVSFHEGGAIYEALRKGVENAASEGIDAVFMSALNLYKLPRGGMGSRLHPGIVSHRHITRELVKLLK